MRRASIAAFAVGTLIATTAIAHAATLRVDAGTLQTFQIAAEITIPADETVAVTARVYRFSSGNKPSLLPNQNEPATAELTKSTKYQLTWDGGSVVTCQSVGYSPAGEVESAPGVEYTATADIARSFCVQTGQGNLQIETLDSSATAATQVPSAGTSIATATPSATTPSSVDTETSDTTVLWSSELEELAAQPCLDDGWRSQLDESGLPYVSEEACVEAKIAEYRERTTSTEQG